MSFENYIKDKNVVFVGACANMIGRKTGAKIDKDHDVVVRTNHSIELVKDKNFVIDYGAKCDVLYANNQYYREMRPLPATQYMRQNLKWLCMKNISPADRLKYQKRIKIRIMHRSMREVIKKISSPTMGSFLVYDILQCRPKKLFLYGFDFFVSRNPIFKHDSYSEYYPGYLPEKIREQGNKINKGKTEDGHNFYENAKFMVDLFQKNNNLLTENYMREILQKIISKEINQGDIKWK